jgi:hypothetical protein
MADDEPLKPEDFPVHTNQKQIVKNDGKTIAGARTNCRRRCGALERGKGPSRRRPLVGITFPTDSAIGVRLPSFLMQNKGRKNGKPTKE